MLKKLWNNEAGFIISAELVLVLTIAVLGMVVGLSHVAMAVNEELSDIGQAIGSLNQSYSFVGYHCCSIGHGCGYTSFVAGSAFRDSGDICDCNDSCDLLADPTSEKGGGHGGNGGHGWK